MPKTDRQKRRGLG